jgi:uncharacterized protein (DUF2267 family)
MAREGLPVFDETLQLTHIWLKRLMAELHTEDRQQAYLALRAVLHALRDNLTVEEATDLGAQLPMLVRGIYYEGWNPAKTPARERSRQAFFDHVNRILPGGFEYDADLATRAVFKLLAERVTAGEIKDVKSMLPKDLKTLWP